MNRCVAGSRLGVDEPTGGVDGFLLVGSPVVVGRAFLVSRLVRIARSLS
jgi:hypothetical protein